jgi:hypothetical protein
LAEVTVQSYSWSAEERSQELCSIKTCLADSSGLAECKAIVIPSPDVGVSDILLFLAITIQIGSQGTILTGCCWSALEKFYMPFYSNLLKHDKYLHTLYLLYFTESTQKPDKN